MSPSFHRRAFLKFAASGGVALRFARSIQGAQGDRKIRLGFIGVGARGTQLLKEALVHAEVEVPVVCDINQAHLNRALDIVEKTRGTRPEGFSKDSFDYRGMLARDDFDSVLIATPQEWHAVMSIDSLKAGKFVGSEVPACTAVQECWDLVRTQEETRTGYMLLENYCYSKPVMQILNMVKKDVLGELTYAECAYIHEIRNMRFNPDGTLTWRGKNAAENIGNLYPTHAMGPVCQWMSVNRGDRLTSLVAMSSKSAANHVYAVEKFGKDHPAAKIKFLNGDSNNCLIRTEQGRMIEIRYDTASPRPSGMGQYALQGTRGAYESAFGQHKIYLEGRSPQHSWEPLDQYESEFQHPYWAEKGEEARKTGHSGGDYFVVSDFLRAIRTGQSPIDIYDAVTWSVIRPLSAVSIEGGSKPVDIPDFKSSREKGNRS